MADFPEHLLGYQDMRGILELRQALARFLMSTSMKVSRQSKRFVVLYIL